MPPPTNAPMAELDPVTLGEVWRSLGSMQSTLNTVAGDVSEMKTTGATSGIQLVHLDQRVSKLEDTNKWLWRTVAALIIGAVLAGVLSL